MTAVQPLSYAYNYTLTLFICKYLGFVIPQPFSPRLVEPPRVLRRLWCAPGIARSSCLISDGCAVTPIPSSSRKTVRHARHARIARFARLGTAQRERVGAGIVAGQRPRPSFGHPRRSTPTTEFRAPTCVLKGSDDDDVEDRRHDPCCASDGGRSSGVAVQAEIPNHRRLRRSRAGVVSAAGDVSLFKRGRCAMRRRTCVNHC